MREQGHEVFQYLDDSFVVADAKEKYEDALRVLCNTVSQLGFVIHDEKSVLDPDRNLKFLGFELDSDEMTVQLMQDKVEKFTRSATQLLEKSLIWDVAVIVELMISYLPAFHYAAPHVKCLEKDKIEALKLSKLKVILILLCLFHKEENLMFPGG